MGGVRRSVHAFFKTADPLTEPLHQLGRRRDARRVRVRRQPIDFGPRRRQVARQPIRPLTLFIKGIVATPGDADLSGKIDFDDYARIDAGFNQGFTGWGNGDFNGDGRVDFDDYALIDTNFNSPPLAGFTRAVPEPAFLCPMWLLLITQHRRRRLP